MREHPSALCMPACYLHVRLQVSSLRAATLLCVVRLCIARDEQFSCCVGCVGCVSCVSHVETYFYVLPQEQVARHVARRFASGKERPELQAIGLAGPPAARVDAGAL